VCAAAGRIVSLSHTDHTHEPINLRWLAQRNAGELIRRVLASADRQVRGDNGVGILLDCLSLVSGKPLQRNIDGGFIGSQMERKRAGIQQSVKSRRKDVLPSVLLHVVKPASPIDSSADGIGLHRPGQHMHDLTINFLHIDHRYAIEMTGVMWLASRVGIETGLIQNNGRLTTKIRLPHRPGGKLGTIGILPEKTNRR